MKNKQNIQKVDKNMGTKYKKSIKLKKKMKLQLYEVKATLQQTISN